jgi:hypothetical protein
MRALIVSNMAASAERPALGAFVRTQAAALRREVVLDDLDARHAPPTTRWRPAACAPPPWTAGSTSSTPTSA